MHFSPLSEAYGLRKKQKKEKMTEVVAPPPAPAPAPVEPVSAPAPAPVEPVSAPAPVSVPAPVVSAPSPVVSAPSFIVTEAMTSTSPSYPFMTSKKRKKSRESFLCRFSEEEKMYLILILQMLNFAVMIYILLYKRS